MHTLDAKHPSASGRRFRFRIDATASVLPSRMRFPDHRCFHEIPSASLFPRYDYRAVPAHSTPGLLLSLEATLHVPRLTDIVCPSHVLIAAVSASCLVPRLEIPKAGYWHPLGHSLIAIAAQPSVIASSVLAQLLPKRSSHDIFATVSAAAAVVWRPPAQAQLQLPFVFILHPKEKVT